MSEYEFWILVFNCNYIVNSLARSNNNMINFMNILQKNRLLFTLGEQAHWHYALRNNKTITTTFLSIKLFPCGDEFYVKGKRIFFNDLESIFYIFL